MHIEFYQSNLFRFFIQKLRVFLEKNAGKKIALFGDIESLLQIHRMIDLEDKIKFLITNRPINEVPLALFPKGITFETPRIKRTCPILTIKDYDYVIMADFFNIDGMIGSLKNVGYGDDKTINLFREIDETVRCFRYGLMWDLDLTNNPEQGIYTGHFEDEDISIWRSILREGDNAIDIGSNIGIYSMIGSRAVGPDGKIVAIEPVPRMAAKSQAIIDLNKIENVVLFNGFAGAKSGERECPELDIFTWQRSLLKRGKKTWIVPVKTVDDLVEENNLQSVRAIKIDVDGSCYYDVLEGAKKTIESFRPYLLIEFLAARTRETANQKTIRYLSDLQYKIYHTTNHGTAYGIHPDDIFETLPYGYNFLFVPQEKVQANPITSEAEEKTVKLVAE